MKKRYKIIITSILLFVSTTTHSFSAKPATIYDIAKNPDNGLVLFYNTQCEKCYVQIDEFKKFLTETKWKTFYYKEINLQKCKSEREVIELSNLVGSYNLEYMPELWYVSKDGKKWRIGVDYVSKEEIKKRIVDYINTNK